MRKSLPFAFLVVSLSMVSCAKDAQDVAQDLGLLPAGCGSDGARLQATVGGTAYCAGAQVIATGDGSSTIVTGIDLGGSTLVLQLDTLATGEHIINEANNSVLYMQAGSTYTVAPNVQGTLNILLHDAPNRRLTATFQVPVWNALNGVTKDVEGEVDVTYSTGG